MLTQTVFAQQMIVISLAPLGPEYYEALPEKLRPKQIKEADAFAGNIFAYGGAYGFTNPSTGQILFSKQHLDNQIKILVSTNIEPIVVEKSVKHFKISNLSPTSDQSQKEKPSLGKMFTFTKNDSGWNLDEEQVVQDQIIEKSTIIFLDNPDRVFFNESFSLKHAEDFILPTIMIDTTLKKPENANFFPVFTYLERLTNTEKSTGKTTVSSFVSPGIKVNNLPTSESSESAKKSS